MTAPAGSQHFVAGRRGGLARQTAPVAVAGPVGAETAGVAVPAIARRLGVWGERVRWTLVFFSFFAFAGGVVASRLSVGQPLMILGVVGVLLQREPTRLGPVPALLAAWTAWSAFGYFTSPHPDAVSEPLTQLLKLCVISLVGVNALRTTAQARAYCGFVVVAFLLYPGRGALLNWITGANTAMGRAIWNGVYANPNDLAGISLLIVSAGLAFMAGVRQRRLKLAALGAVGFVAFVIFITQSRGALIALGVFVVVALKRMPSRQRLRAVVAVSVLGAVVVAYAPSSVWDRLSGLKNVTSSQSMQGVDPEGSAEQRWEIWKVARTIIAEHPLTGVGIGAYSEEHGRVAIRPEFKPTARGKRDTHSMYLNVMAETGIPGLCLFMAMLVVTVRYVDGVRSRLRKALPDAALQIQFLELGLLAFCIAGLWGSYAKLNVLYLHLTLMWSLAKAYERQLAAAPALTRAAWGR